MNQHLLWIKSLSITPPDHTQYRNLLKPILGDESEILVPWSSRRGAVVNESD